MRAPGRILKTKTFHPVSEFSEGRRGRSAGEPTADDYDLKLSPVVWADQSRMVLMISPFLIQRPRRNFGIQCSDHAVKYPKTSRDVILIPQSREKNLGPNLERFINGNTERCFASPNMTASGYDETTKPLLLFAAPLVLFE
jgi:hypothetical protein